jgi:antitoxin HicB
MKRDQLKLDDYPFQVRPLTADEGGGYLIEFPDVPGCIADGETPAEAIVNGRDALKSVLVTMREFGDPIPKPGRAAAASGQWRQRVPKSMHSRLVDRAAREGVSLNTLVTAMIAEGLGGRKQDRATQNSGGSGQGSK